MNDVSVSLKNILAAEAVVYAHLKPTRLTFYQGLSDLVGAAIHIKHENHQPGGSFKIRGGVNVMHHLKKAGVGGVITFSTGNHGISIATAAKIFGIRATIVVPEGSSREKITMIREAGADLVEAGKNFEEAARIGLEIQKKNDLRFIHAANEPHLINGVGTGFVEIVKDLPDVDAVILPIGGGSELAAAVTVFKRIKPEVEIYAVQAEASMAACLSWKAGKILGSDNATFAGGFATGEAFELPFGIYRDQLADFVLLSEDEIREGIRMALAYTHNLAEGAGASTIMAALRLRDRLKGKNVALQMSGANETMDVLRAVMQG